MDPYDRFMTDADQQALREETLEDERRSGFAQQNEHISDEEKHDKHRSRIREGLRFRKSIRQGFDGPEWKYRVYEVTNTRGIAAVLPD